MAARIQVNADAAPDAPVGLIETAVRVTLAHEGRTQADFSVTLLADTDIRALNRSYLSRDRPTDVIAFSLGTAEATVGDVYIGVEQARRQAEEFAVPQEEELARLAVHGTLHVLGHDHPDGEAREASPMFALQERLVRDILAGS